MLITLAMVINCHLLPAAEDQQFLNQKDALIGTCGADEISVSDPTRHVNGRVGKDVFTDKSIKPTQIQGGTGNDTFYAGAGVDIYYGGSGYDLYIFDGQFGADTIVDLQIHQGDRLIFIVYQENILDVEKIKRERSQQVGKDYVIDLSMVSGFKESKLTLLNMSKAQFDKLNIELRVSK